MLSEKRKNREKYLAARKQVRELVYRLRTWGHDDLIDVLDSTYKIASFFHTYYREFQRRSAVQLVRLQGSASDSSENTRKIYLLWRLISAISISNALEIYGLLGVSLTLGDTRGESFYSGIPPVTQDEIDFALKIRSLYTDIQPTMERGVRDLIEERYGVGQGEYGEKGFDSIEEIPTVEVPGLCGVISFCPAMIMEDGRYHVWNR